VAQGLEVAREPADEDQLAGAGMALDADDVADLDPTGPVNPGTRITLFVAEKDFAPDEERSATPTETTSAAPSTSPGTTAASTPPETTTPSTEPEPEPTVTAPTLGGTAEPSPSASEPPVTEPGAEAPVGDGTE